MSQMSLAELKARSGAPAVAVSNEVAIGFETVAGFEALQRMAKTFASSPITPETFRYPFVDDKGRAKGASSKEEAIGSCSIALDMALRMHANPLMVMQNLYVVHGRPAWSAKFLLATLLKSGRYNGIHYEFSGTENEDDWGCTLVAQEVATGMEVQGPRITIALAKAEGWYNKPGSKWRTMPDMMLRYRAVSWFVQTYCPDIAMGLPEAEEARDVIDVTPVEVAVEDVPAKPEITIEDVKAKATRSRKKKQEPQHPAEEAIMPNEESAAVEPETILEELVPQAPAMEEQPSQEQIACPADNNENVYISYCQNSCRHYAERTCPAWDWGQE